MLDKNLKFYIYNFIILLGYIEMFYYYEMESYLDISQINYPMVEKIFIISINIFSLHFIFGEISSSLLLYNQIETDKQSTC